MREQANVSGGYELQRTDAKGEGVFTTRPFQSGETVMVGTIDRELDHNHAHASQVSEGRFVLHGGLIPKVNHSCEPNCGIRLNADGAHDLVARRPIPAEHEITFDYAMRNYSVDHFAAHCRCGSPHCRDRITGWKDLPAERKAAYRGFTAPYLTDYDSRRATESAGRLARTAGAGIGRPPLAEVADHD
ncbi:SET domain-containing protein-lysine N-methyltransferase [Streptomyces sp. P9-A2]|uniref:SET domain-containing protein-lysine N-methyltransferase n=1 Tax=Streptomyces sp. P9-A2 TaxID=3072284 RepID=UPI002FC86E06